ncbi:MAG: hypothetical protein U1A78_27590 [Polyangia bacterium]
MSLPRLLSAILCAALCQGVALAPAAAEPVVPAGKPAAVSAKVKELMQQARDLFSASLKHARRDSPQRIDLLQRATQILTRVVQLDEHNVEARVTLAEWLARPELGPAAMQRSEEELLRARRDDTTGAWDCEISSQLGIVLSHLGRFAEAVREYDRALRLLPGEPDLATASRRGQQATLLGNSAEALMALGDLSGAIQRYTRAEQLDTSDQAALHALGLAIAYDRDGQFQKSREAVSRSLAADPALRLFQSDDVFFAPEGDRAYYEGMLAEAFGNRDDALRHFQAFVQTLPHSRFVARAREHIDELRKQPGVSATELWKARVLIGSPTFTPEETSLSARRHRDDSEIGKVTRGPRGLELRHCYAMALRKNPRIGGDLMVALVLDRHGAVLLVQPLQNTLGDPSQSGTHDPLSGTPPGSASASVSTELLRCVVGSIHRWRFPAADADVVDQDELVLPMRFEAR